MINPIPEGVDQVLREWDTIAFIAYEGFEQQGRGGVGIEPKEEGFNLFYVEREYFAQKDDQEALRLIDAYEPKQEFVAIFESPKGVMRLLRIRTPEGGRNPKHVWFFEMLRRTDEAPDPRLP